MQGHAQDAGRQKAALMLPDLPLLKLRALPNVAQAHVRVRPDVDRTLPGDVHGLLLDHPDAQFFERLRMVLKSMFPIHFASSAAESPSAPASLLAQ